MTPKETLERANFRRKEEGTGESCSHCKYEVVHVLDPNDDDSEREFYCTKHQIKFSKEYRPWNYTCDYADDSDFTKRLQEAFGPQQKKKEEKKPFLKRLFGKKG